ncbi:MAG: hypothetical protein IJP14_04795 [Clostridia bacterium]|nr:hypothetical protein [Clostridia bacterium]
MKTMGKQAKRLLAIVCAMALCATMVLTLHVAADDPTDPPRTNLINAQTKFEPVYIENANDNDAIWVDTHQYGSVTGPGWYQSSWYPSKLYDGATDANAYPNVVSNADYGYGHVWAADGGAATAASRRHGFWFDLGQLYNLNEINVHVPTAD